MEPLVSIITPMYNSEKYIGETIESVLSQTYQNWEMVIVNDCSTDKGSDIVKEYQKKDSRIKLYNNEKNKGGAETRNECIRRATGDYMAFLDSDDMWNKDKLEKQIAFMQKNGYSFTYSKYERVDEEGNRMYLVSKILEELDYKDMLFRNPIGCLTAIYDAKKLGKIYLPPVKVGQDFALWLEVLKKSKYGYGLDETLARYRVRGNSLSKSKVKKLGCMYDIYRKYNNQNLIKTLFYLFQNVIDSYFNLKVEKISNK